MKHIRTDRVVSFAEIGAIVSELRIESETALRTEVVDSRGFRGLNLAIERLQKLEGR
jgi:hypothetical protein